MPQYWLPVYAFATATAHSLARTPAIRIVLKIYFHYSSKHFMFTANRNFNSIRAQQQERWEKWSSNKRRRRRRRRHVYEIVKEIKKQTFQTHKHIPNPHQVAIFFHSRSFLRCNIAAAATAAINVRNKIVRALALIIFCARSHL